ncbi:MAG: hypothetical protein P4L40_00750 [Terracidiphilus sp.]|nr:hypothetical protein [Terracidiphilus sp.]
MCVCAAAMLVCVSPDTVPSCLLVVLQMEALWKKCLQSQSGESVLWLDFIGYVASLYSSFTVSKGVSSAHSYF